MNIAKAFVEFMEDNSLGTVGDDIYLGSAPLDADDNIWWVVNSGGTSVTKASTGEKVKNYTLNVFYRNTDPEDVYDTMEAFESLINSKNCTQMDGYETVEMEAVSFPADQDIDNQERTVGLVEVTLTIYADN